MAIDYGQLASTFLSGSRGAPQSEYGQAKQSARQETDNAESKTLGVIGQAAQMASTQGMEQTRQESAWAQHLMDYSQRNYQFDKTNARADAQNDMDLKLKEFAFERSKVNAPLITEGLEQQNMAMDVGNKSIALANLLKEQQFSQQAQARDQLHKMLGQSISYNPKIKGAGAVGGWIGDTISALNSITLEGELPVEQVAEKLGVQPGQLETIRGMAQVNPIQAFQDLKEAQALNIKEGEKQAEHGAALLSSVASLVGKESYQGAMMDYMELWSTDPKKASEYAVEFAKNARSQALKNGRLSTETSFSWSSDDEITRLVEPAYTDEDKADQRQIIKDTKTRMGVAQEMLTETRKIYAAAESAFADPKVNSYMGAPIWDRLSELTMGGEDEWAQTLFSGATSGLMTPITIRTPWGNRTMFVRSDKHLSKEEEEAIGSQYMTELKNRVETGGDPNQAHVGMRIGGQVKLRDESGLELKSAAMFEVTDVVGWNQNGGTADPALRTLPNSESHSSLPIDSLYRGLTGKESLPPGVNGNNIGTGIDNLMNRARERDNYSVDQAFEDIMDGRIEPDIVEGDIRDEEQKHDKVVPLTVRQKGTQQVSNAGRFLRTENEVPSQPASTLIALPMFAGVPQVIDPNNPDHQVWMDRNDDLTTALTMFSEEALLNEGGIADQVYEMMSDDLPPDALLEVALNTMSGMGISALNGGLEGVGDNESLDTYTIAEEGHGTMTRMGDAIQDSATKGLLDNYRSAIWQEITVPAIRAGIEANEPKMASYDMETKEGAAEWEVAHKKWSEIRASAVSLGGRLPNGQPIEAPEVAGAEVLKVGTNQQAALGRFYKYLDGLAATQVTQDGAVARNSAANTPEQNAATVKWMHGLRRMMAGDGGEDLEWMTKNLNDSPKSKAILKNLKELDGKNFLPGEVPKDMLVDVPYANGWAQIPLNYVREFWDASDVDNNSLKIEDSGKRVSKVMAGIYGTKNIGAISLRGLSSDDLYTVDTAILPMANLFQVPADKLGEAIGSRMQQFIPINSDFRKRVGRVQPGKGISPTERVEHRKNVTWAPGTTKEKGIHGVMLMIPPGILEGYTEFGDAGIILSAFKSGLGPSLKANASPEFRRKHIYLFQALEAAEARTMEWNKEKNPGNSRGTSYSHHKLAQAFNRAALTTTEFKKLAEWESSAPRRAIPYLETERLHPKPKWRKGIGQEYGFVVDSQSKDEGYLREYLRRVDDRVLGSLKIEKSFAGGWNEIGSGVTGGPDYREDGGRAITYPRKGQPYAPGQEPNPANPRGFGRETEFERRHRTKRRNP